MNARANTLFAVINGQDVGSLRDENGIWSFEYATSWLNDDHSYDLAPGLPRSAGRITDESTQRPVQWFFDNLLPEDAAREVLAREAQIDSADAFALLAYYGRESAGAITLLVLGEQPAAPDYQPLSDAELHERIARLPRQSLSSGAPKKMSNAGGQHKLAVSIREGKLFHPVGDAPSTHLLKPDHKDTDLYPSSAANEFFIMRLALRMRLAVPPVEIRFVPDPVYLIERFDREATDGQTTRLHIIDACQLLGVDRSFKYHESRAAILVQCIERCENRARTRQSLIAWALFNLLVGNGDAHLKNISFRVGPHGLELAPFYDLLSTECYRAGPDSMPRWPQTPLTMQIGEARTFGAVTRADFLAFADQLGAGTGATVRMLDEYCDTIQAAADEVLAEFEAIRIPEPMVRAGALRTLRLARFSVIGNMVKQLTA